MKHAPLVVAVATLLILGTASAAHALPGTAAEPWPEVGPLSGSRVRAIEVVDGTIWLGGKFTTATDSSGETRAVSNLVAFDATTGRFASVNCRSSSAPRCGTSTCTAAS